MPYHFPFATGLADAETEAREFLGAHVGDEGFNAVVAACGAFFPQLDHAQGEIHFIMNDEHAAGIQFEKPHHGAHAQTGFIHERGGFHQQDAGAGGHLALALPVRLEYGPPPGGQAVKHHEPRVMAGVFIGSARVAQAHDHFNGCIHNGKKGKR